MAKKKAPNPFTGRWRIVSMEQWDWGYGHIEIGDQEMFGFVVRALYYWNLAFEDDKPDTLAEAMAALEKGLKKWFDEQGIDLE